MPPEPDEDDLAPMAGIINGLLITALAIGVAATIWRYL